MTHRILLVLLSCTALGWAGPAMADDEGSGVDYGYDSAAEGAAEADAAMANAQYQTVMPDGSIVYGSRNDAAAADGESADVAGDQSYYDYGGAAATTSSGFDGVTNWTDESGATPTGNTITNWTEGDVDPLAAGGGGSFLDPAIGGIGAMSGFSMQNLSKLFNPTKPGGCNMSVPMMNNLSGNLAAFGKFLGAKESCDGARTLSGVKATVDAQGAVRTRALAEQQRYVSGAQINQANASGILAGGGGGASGGGGLFEGIVGVGGIDVALSGMVNNAIADSGLGKAMNTFNELRDGLTRGRDGLTRGIDPNSASMVINDGYGDLMGVLNGTSTGSFNFSETNWSDVDGGAVYSRSASSYDMGGTAAATTASSMFTFPPGEGASTVVTETYVPGSSAPVTGWTTLGSGGISADN